MLTIYIKTLNYLFLTCKNFIVLKIQLTTYFSKFEYKFNEC